MKRLILTLLTLVSALALLFSLQLTAAAESDIIDSGSCGTNATWTLDADGTLTVSGSGAIGNYGKWQYNYIETFAPWKSHNSEIKKIVVEEGITSIGVAAFCGTVAEEVSLPEGLTTIGDSAFLDSYNLERVILPASVTTLSRYAFAECGNLGLLFAQSDSLSVGEYCFSDNYMCLLYPEGGTVTYGTFDAYSLSRCAYDPEEYAADGTVGSGICGDNAQWTVDIDGVAAVRGTGEVTSTNLSAYKYFLTEITFSEKLEMSSIAMSWMSNAKHLHKITFPSGLKTIQSAAFANCQSLEEIVIPDSVKSIGESAFENCHSLRVAYIPGAPTTVDKAAFSGCDHLTEVHFTGTTTTLESNSYNNEGNVFYRCTALETIYLPQKSVTFGKAFADCALLKNFIVPEDSDYFLDERGVLYHNDDGNVDLTLVRAPVTLAGEYTPIEGCYNFCAYAFAHCTELTEATFPREEGNIYQYLDTGVFYHCTSLTAVHLPQDTFQSIGSRAFEGCTSLAEIELPESLWYINSYAFKDCTSLTKIELPEHFINFQPAIGNTYVEGVFWGCTGLKEVIFPSNLKGLYTAVFEDCSSLERLVFPEGLTMLNGYFPGCDSLRELVFLGSNLSDYSASLFTKHTLTVYYPDDPNATVWTTLTSQNYTTITWRPWYTFGTDPLCTHEEMTQSTVPAGCSWGYVLHACACGYSYRTNFKVGEGHDLYTYAEAAAPTCTEAGHTEEIRCSKCDYVEGGEEIAALGHDYVDGVCTRCGADDPNYNLFDPTEEFNDIPSNAWYLDSVAFAVKNGLMNGMGNGEFQPDESTTRAMVVTILYRLSGSEEKYENSFTDVLANNWYTDAISWAAHYGIVNGMTATTFEPETSMTREMLAVILYRYTTKKTNADTSKKADLSVFPDESSVSPWAKEAMQWAVANGIVNGVGDGKTTYLQPLGNATRAQVAAIFQRYIKNVLNK